MTLHMKKIIITILLSEMVFNFSFDDNKHVFGIGGMSQSRYLHVKPDDSILNQQIILELKEPILICMENLNNGLFHF